MQSNGSVELILELSDGKSLRDYLNLSEVCGLVALWEERLLRSRLAVVEVRGNQLLAGHANLLDFVKGPLLNVSDRNTITHQGEWFIARQLLVGGTPLAQLIAGPYAAEEDLEEDSQAVQELLKVLTTLADQGYRVDTVNKLHLASIEESHRELVHHTKHLELANAKLQELDSLKSNLLSTVSHELRTPLMGVLGFAELLQMEMAATETCAAEQQQYVATILERGSHLLRLINRLLYLTSLERDNSSLEKEVFPVCELASVVSETVREQAHKQGVMVKEELSRSSYQLLADPKLTKEALAALLDNAIKFTRSGGNVLIHVELSSLPLSEVDVPCLVPETRMVKICVRDEGQGIEGPGFERIFDPLYQVNAEDSRSFEGVGIGLTLARRIAEAHGGSVTLDETNQGGSLFSLQVPQANNE